MKRGWHLNLHKIRREFLLPSSGVEHLDMHKIRLRNPVGFWQDPRTLGRPMAVVKNEKNIKAFAPAHVRRTRQTKPNIPPLSERYFGKRSKKC